MPSLPPTTAPPSHVPVSPPSPPPPPQGADKSRPESGESHKENGGERNSRESEHSTPHGGDEHKTGSPHGNSAEKEPYFAPTPLKAAERKHAPFRAFVAAGGTLAAARGSNLMDDISN